MIGDLEASVPPAAGDGSDRPGDGRGSFEDFYRCAYSALVGFVVLQAGSWAEAEDIVQEAFAVAHRRWATVGSYDNPAAWVRLVALNRARSRRRKVRNDLTALARLVGRTDRQSNDGPLPDPPDPRLVAAIRALPKRQATVTLLHYFDELSVAEIARLLSISESAVKTHLGRARDALATILPTEEGQ